MLSAMRKRSDTGRRKPENYELVKEALVKAGREDLIGFDKKCLIPPRKIAGKKPHGRIKAKKGKNNGKV